MYDVLNNNNLNRISGKDNDHGTVTIKKGYILEYFTCGVHAIGCPNNIRIMNFLTVPPPSRTPAVKKRPRRQALESFQKDLRLSIPQEELHVNPMHEINRENVRETSFGEPMRSGAWSLLPPRPSVIGG